MEDERSISEEVVVLSRHVRLAQLRSPMCCRLIPKLRDRLMRSLAEYQVVTGKREIQFCMALEEALNNAFYHGNLELSSKLKEDGSSRFIELAAEREVLSPWCERSVGTCALVRGPSCVVGWISRSCRRTESRSTESPWFWKLATCSAT